MAEIKLEVLISTIIKLAPTPKNANLIQLALLAAA